jgi:hypothetical protein
MGGADQIKSPGGRQYYFAIFLNYFRWVGPEPVLEARTPPGRGRKSDGERTCGTGSRAHDEHQVARSGTTREPLRIAAVR